MKLFSEHINELIGCRYVLQGDAFCLDIVVDQLAVNVDGLGLEMEHQIMCKRDSRHVITEGKCWCGERDTKI